MLQALLAERFQVKVHRETQEIPVYYLEVAKGGPKMKASAPDAESKAESLLASGALFRTKYVNLTMSDLVYRIGSNFDRPLYDKTGLAGGYDFTLEYSPRRAELTGPDAAGDLPIVSAIQAQLGLKVTPAKQQVETLVIDHAERPSVN